MSLALPTFSVDPHRVSISGLSAGAFMAHQLHIAFSDVFHGAGLIAGGPYRVSQGTLLGALAFGMQGQFGASPEFLAETIRVLADRGELAPVKNLERSRVWVFHGLRDTTVSPRVSDALVGLYESFLHKNAIKYVNDVDVVHSMPTDGFGARPTAPSQSPYLVNANYDAAGELLQHLHGPLLPPRAEGELAGEWRRFDQNIFIPNARMHSMDDRGFVYVPSGALRGEKCGIHVALHGCGQSRKDIGDVFVRHAGYNAWAEANNFILIYPQARPLVNFQVYNPRASWDWFGLGRDYSLRCGPQMRAIANMVRKVAGASDFE